MTTIESIRERLARRIAKQNHDDDRRERGRSGLLLDSERTGTLPPWSLDDARVMTWCERTKWWRAP